MRRLLDPGVRCTGCGMRVRPVEERLLRSFPPVFEVEGWCSECRETVRQVRVVDPCE